ncbi:MAG: hypothetical protein K8R25_12600 [Methanosarcinales archaeon]|nr:hypothetical protein [Methanosarcinales archaeon]
MKTRRIIAMAIVMMVLLAVSTVPAMACPCEEGDIVVGNPGVGDPIELTAVEKSKVVGIALKNSQVKKLQKQLIYEGFTQKDPEAFTIPVEEEDGLKTEVLVVAIPFQEDKSENGKTIAYVHNSQTGESISVLVDKPITIKGFTDCSISLAVCLVIAVGCSIPCAACCTRIHLS